MKIKKKPKFPINRREVLALGGGVAASSMLPLPFLSTMASARVYPRRSVRSTLNFRWLPH